MKHPKAFTLIELLVVISIIAVLLSILIPALSTVKDQAKGTICKSNLRQIGIAANLYAHSWQNHIPRGASSGSNIWYQLFMPYLDAKYAVESGDYRDVEIFRCPTYPDKDQTVGYVVNGWRYSGNGDGTEVTEPTRISEFRRASETFYLADNENGPWRSIIRTIDSPDINRLDVFHPGHLPTSTAADVDRGRRIAAARHRKGGSNYLFVDWHVDFVATKDTSDKMWREH